MTVEKKNQKTVGGGVTQEKKTAVNDVGDATKLTEKKDDANVEATETQKTNDESKDDDVVIIEEKSEETKPTAETAEGEKPAEGTTQTTQGNRKKKERVFKRKVVRIPREVFDYMVRIEEDGTIRLNVTQFNLFFTNEILNKTTSVSALSWETEEVPLMNISVPPTAKENPILIVDNFSSEPKDRETQEKRLQSMLEGRKRFADKQKQLEADIAAGKITLADLNKKKNEQTGKKGTNDGSPNKKRNATSSATESGSAAKQPRLDEKNSAQSKSGKTGSKKTGAQNGAKATPKGSSRPTPKGPIRSLMSQDFSPYRSAPAPFASPLMGRREWQSGPAPFESQRYQQGNMYGGQMRYGEQYPFNDGRGGADISPWARPPANQPDEFYKLESVMRRAAEENSSSLDAVRQVEKMGLGPVMGAILKAVDRGNSGYPSYDTPSRKIPSLIDEPFERDPRLPGGLDYNPSPVRDINRYVEPLGGSMDSSRMRSSQPVDRITYPSLGGGGGGSGPAPLFGQSYSAFASQSYGGATNYGNSSVRRPYR